MLFAAAARVQPSSSWRSLCDALGGANATVCVQNSSRACEEFMQDGCSGVPKKRRSRRLRRIFLTELITALEIGPGVILTCN